MAEIVLEGVGKAFPDGTVAVRDVSLAMEDGEFVVLVGPSGSGKSTVLRMIAGLEEVTSGTIRIGDRVVNDVSPAARDIAMVFQNYALYPHMTVYGNMAFALKLRKVPKDEIDRRVREAAELLSITELLRRKPRQLSGGQRQRVAMGRAIVREPAAFLMDEPLSNLDAKLRVQTRSEISRLHQRLGTSIVYVTHDQVEAVTMADRVAVLREGMLQQFGTPDDLYEKPVNVFVAGFIGSPAMNLVASRVVAEDGDVAVSFGSHQLELSPAVARSLADRQGKEVLLGIRPEDIEDPEFAAFDGNARLEVAIDLVENLGAERIAHFEVDAPPVRTRDTEALAADLERGSEGPTNARLVARPDHVAFTARLHPRSLVSAGHTTKLAVDVSRLYFFDPDTGEAIPR
ncbi:MAG TPA: sn-glycerol-3-phosphate ABC transporter ATP-binding protein UgpC [Acidimicrobiales bacterium]|nr:sn-glycerol-3-phosphate ABC transporter ATP-binding protein UgpC [Acidimicrobiales bacterium]